MADSIENFNYEDLKAITIDTPPTGATIEKAKSDELVEKLKDKMSITWSDSFVSLCIISQKGGTANKAQGTVYAIVNGKKIELSTVRKVMKDNNMNFTLRQWARSNASAIHKVCSYYSIEGDLAKKLSRDRSDITKDEKIWLSNFQMDNEDCPENIRRMLMAHYEGLFNK